MLEELRVSVTEAVVAITVIVAASTGLVLDKISSDAWIALMSVILGYVFGRVRNGRETSEEKSPEARSNTKTNPKTTTTPTAVIADPKGITPEEPEHTVPGTTNEGE